MKSNKRTRTKPQELIPSQKLKKNGSTASSNTKKSQSVKYEIISDEDDEDKPSRGNPRGKKSSADKERSPFYDCPEYVRGNNSLIGIVLISNIFIPPPQKSNAPDILHSLLSDLINADRIAVLRSSFIFDYIEDDEKNLVAKCIFKKLE